MCACSCVCVCVYLLLSSVRLWLSVMSEWVRPGQIRDPVANTASHYTLPPIAKILEHDPLA